ncbi:MAG: hypothetical protein ACRC8S_21590 [Fimbriiglobus sp.]
MSQTNSQSQAAPQKPAPSQLQESLLGYLVDTCVKRPYFALQGRRHRRKIDVVTEEIEATTRLLDPKRDRIGVAGFHSGYTTFLAPTHDFRRLRPALKKARQATLDLTPRGSRLFPAIGELEDAFRAYSTAETIQIGIILSDGADTSGESAEDAGRRSQEFMLGPFSRRHITLIGIGKDQAVSYGSLGRYAKTANLVMHDELYGLSEVIKPIIHRVVAWAITKATPGDIVASLGLGDPETDLARERPGIDLVYLIDCSPSMRDYATSSAV